jgi:hypothetical protein
MNQFGGYCPTDSISEQFFYSLTAPRIGSRDRPDEPWAFESREFVRSLLVGKEIGLYVTVVHINFLLLLC